MLSQTEQNSIYILVNVCNFALVVLSFSSSYDIEFNLAKIFIKPIIKLSLYIQSLFYSLP